MFHIRIMMLASRSWISDIAAAVIAETATPAASGASLVRSGAA